MLSEKDTVCSAASQAGTSTGGVMMTESIPSKKSELKIDDVPMDERVRWMMKVRMITMNDIRSLFGMRESDKWGHWSDHYMARVIGKYSYWIDYAKGDRVLEGHSHWVTSAVVSTDGRWLFTGSYDTSIIKWDLLNDSMVRQTEACHSLILSFAYCPSSLISGCKDGTLQVWNPDNLELMRTLVGHSDYVNSVSLNERGTLIVSGSTDNTIRLWSVQSGECTRVMKGHSESVASVTFLSDYVLSGSEDRSMKVWSVVDASEPRTIKEGIKDCIIDLSINCDGSLVACMFGFGFTVYNWPKLDVMRTVKVNSDHGCFHPCNPDILTVNDLSSLRIYLISTGDCIQSFKGQSSFIWDVCFTPDGYRLISASNDKDTGVWDTSDL